MKPFSHALLFVSLLSYVISFPCDSNILKSYPKKNDGSRSYFRRNSYSPSHRYIFLPEVFVLSLSPSSQSSKSDLGREVTNKEWKSNRKINEITVKPADKIGAELPLRTIEYRRRKHEWAERYTSQEGLREAFGSNRNKWWGDLDANTARRLYKSLLFPSAISELVLELGDEIVRPEELAPLAYEARKAAKMYVRERCRVPSRVGAYLFDGFRQLRKYGRFQPNGASYEQLWIRYYEENESNNNTDDELDYFFGHDDHDEDGVADNDAGDIIDEIDDAVTEEEIVKRTCKKILEKSCTTNEAIDRFYLKEYNINAKNTKDNDVDIPSVDIIGKIDYLLNIDNDDSEYKIVNEKTGRCRRWRNRRKRKDRYNDLLLERITKTLEKDIRKLLAPPPSSLSSSVPCMLEEDVYGNFDESQSDERSCNNNNGESGREKGNLSSPMMTRQEYHSLKLFAKARKNFQHHQSKDNTSNSSTKRPQYSSNDVNGVSKGVSVFSPVTTADRKSDRDEGE